METLTFLLLHSVSNPAFQGKTLQLSAKPTLPSRNSLRIFISQGNIQNTQKSTIFNIQYSTAFSLAFSSDCVSLVSGLIFLSQHHEVSTFTKCYTQSSSLFITNDIQTFICLLAAHF